MSIGRENLIACGNDRQMPGQVVKLLLHDAIVTQELKRLNTFLEPKYSR